MTHLDISLWIVTSIIWLFVGIRRIVRRDLPALGWFLCAAYVLFLAFWVRRWLKF